MQWIENPWVKLKKEIEETKAQNWKLKHRKKLFCQLWVLFHSSEQDWSGIHFDPWSFLPQTGQI